MRYKVKGNISQIWYENGKEVDRDCWQEIHTYTISDSEQITGRLLAKVRFEDRMFNKYKSNNGEWEVSVNDIIVVEC